MTVQKDVTKNIYVGNGSTRTFPFTFECPAEHPEYIKVYLMQDDGTALATSDYQLDMDARQITYPSSGTALPEGKKLVIMRELPLQQMMNLVNNGPYFAEDVETAFDENVMAMQQIAEKLNRSIIMNVDIDGDAFVNEVPFEAGKSFRIADDGKSIVLTEDPARVLPLAQEAYAQAQAQAQSAAASATAAAKSEDSAFESAGVAGNSAQYASLSAASAAENAELTSGYKQEALTAKADATASATNAKASEANAKTSENNAEASKEAAQSAATTASNYASASRGSANEAQTFKTTTQTYMNNAELYMNNAKNYSENVNVFIPSVSSSGVLSWTNKAGLDNPASVNIKGAKGDKGDAGAQGIQGAKGDKGDKGEQGLQGIAGTAATIRIGSVYTGEPGTNASVSNSGTSTNAILNFTIPRGNPGSGGGSTVDVDAALSDSSLNPVQNKVIKEALDGKLGKTETAAAATHDGAGNVINETYTKKADFDKVIGELGVAFQEKVDRSDLADVATSGSYNDLINKPAYIVQSVNNVRPDDNGNVTINIPTKVSTLENDAGYLNMGTLPSFPSTDSVNTWKQRQTFYEAVLKEAVLAKARIVKEVYQSEYINGTAITPTRSTMCLTATGATTLDMTTIVAECLGNNRNSTVFTAYITSDADYTLTITNAGTIKYIGSASDFAITSAGLLLNIMMLKDASGNVTSIVQASNLS